MTRRKPEILRRGALALTLGLALAACDPMGPVAIEPAEPRLDAGEPSEESRRLAAYYGGVQARLLSQGLLRRDGGGPDTYFSTRNLVENFERIALYDEYALQSGTFVQRQTPSRLRRWEVPIRMRLVFGPSVTDEQRARDRRNVETYNARIARLTGHRIGLTEGPANFIVLFLNRDEQRTIGPRLEELVPRISPTVVNEITHSPRSTFCAAYALSERKSNHAYTAAVVLVKAEHPDLLRLSCIHEEIAQAMGLANDSPVARPSIFNDDEEFALLTEHDELLLQILYDRRLRLGMTPAEARPIVSTIAAELMGEGAS
nr:DUF2927 domain-containing protein [Maritimibacter sp. 55A14]